MKSGRVAIAGLSLSAAALIGLWGREGWTERAVIPVPGDVPTIGPGLTQRADGTPVQLGDRITPLDGARRSLAHIQRDEAGLKRCVTVELHQAEYDAYLSLAYNIGVAAFCSSTLVKRLNAGDYAGACAEILRWDKFRGQPLRGLTLRRQAEYRQCVDAG
ncbi:glycoside hydrolase family protein [uncultured Azohydromonas sp.]|jgi:Phage-related lysozyme (muraminidase)|uniref:glycoside hydrolase family protein n=1 Tax=uncultured Azohydromonas sp. TaxID=487342 RepID=UPI00262E67D0|nr:glycoside hydrolase family protein [uncultured Azohydromonas sp.]